MARKAIPLEEQERDTNQLNELRGVYLGSPVLVDGLWVFGGGQRRPKLLVEVGSYWRWRSYDEQVFDSHNLNQTSATYLLLPFESEDFQIRSFSRQYGEYLHIYTGPHCCLSIQPGTLFDPSGHVGSPLKVRIRRENQLVYEDWNDEETNR